jgi:hypothetical protein
MARTRYFFIISSGAPAAYALGLLAKQRLPDLPASLIKARSSDEGLQEVAAAIESVEPGLLRNRRTGLRHSSSTSDDF